MNSKTLSFVLFLFAVIKSHEQFESEIDRSEIGKQTPSATGTMLGNYGVSFERDLPIYMTTNLMFSEVIDNGRAILRQNGIFADPKTGMMPSWFLMFSMPKCGHCVEVKPDIIELAKFFHDQENTSLNYRVAEIDCTAEEARDLCIYFGINKLPKFMILRPDTDLFYLFPNKETRNFDHFQDFALNRYTEAFI